MKVKQIFYTLFWSIFSCAIYSQTQGIVKGIVVSESGEPISYASVILKGTKYGTVSNDNGTFTFKAPSGNYTLQVSSVGLKTFETPLRLTKESNMKIVLQESSTSLKEISLSAKSKAQKIKETGFNVSTVETTELQTQSVEINRLLDRTAGIKVRQTGGIGSNYNYSISGMSGKSIAFFIDGIPMDYFGSSYTINNLPVSLINRIDIYKGVVPANLGSDALGGAINVVTNTKTRNFLETSYSYGSFNTHQAALNGQYTDSVSHFTARLSSFYTYSDNNYKVWGRGVNYADKSTGFKAIDFTKENPATRFNDQFETLNGKLDLGFVNKKWADQFFVSLLASTQKKGIQNGQTMSTVYGKLHYKEFLLMPHLSYQKKNLFTQGLDVKLFSGYTKREGTTVDLSDFTYGWNGIIGNSASGGELSYNGKSEFTMFENSWVNRVNLTYQLPAQIKLGVNYFISKNDRRGKDPYASYFRLPFTEPQYFNKQFAGLFLETKKLDDKLDVNAFVKWYQFKTSSNEVVYLNGEDVTLSIKNEKANWGGGLAGSYKISPKFLVKFSIEQATRLPTPTEALGNGLLIVNNPNIKPEQSLNINLGLALGKIAIGEQQGLRIATDVFYRNTKDLLLYLPSGRDEGYFQNVAKVLGKGIELDIAYDLNHWLKANVNATYLDLRNNQDLDKGSRNIVYKDRLRNTPYFLANAGVSANFENIIQKESKLFAYLHANYLHEFYLNWPSLGSKNTKNIIPSQTVFDIGVGYTFPKQDFSIGLDVSNFTNTQAYDNFLLQKPGRAAFIKLKYLIN